MLPGARIRYISGYRYQLVDQYSVQTGITGHEARTQYLELKKNGWLYIAAGDCWDGATGAFDTRDFMRGSLVHDALYQLIRLGKLPLNQRENCDRELYRLCREDGMSWVRARYVFIAVRLFGAFGADPANKRTIQVAP